MSFTDPDPTPIGRLMRTAVESGITPSAVAMVVTDGITAGPVSTGDAVAFADHERRAEHPVAATSDTSYDLASVTKVATATTMLALVDDGLVNLDTPVAEWLPAFGSGNRTSVTIRLLLTHTSGLPGVWDGWRAGPMPRETALAEILASPLVAEPGTEFRYSCVGYLTAMAIGEAATGLAWRDVVEARLLAPLRALDPDAADLTFDPDPARTAATEYQGELGRGMVRGVVHDETAAALGGAAGNAGLFGTAAALAALGEALRGGLRGILAPESADELWRDHLVDVLGQSAVDSRADYGHGLGLRIGQREWMSENGGRARGHNGFTGTSLLVDRERRLTVVLLTNRVHPSRDRSSVQRLRADVAQAAYTGAVA